MKLVHSHSPRQPRKAVYGAVWILVRRVYEHAKCTYKRLFSGLSNLTTFIECLGILQRYEQSILLIK